MQLSDPDMWNDWGTQKLRSAPKIYCKEIKPREFRWVKKLRLRNKSSELCSFVDSVGASTLIRKFPGVAHVSF
jgi:hypothetical protein